MKISRTELVWPGKYDADGNRVEPQRASLPFQVIETVKVSRVAREAVSRPQQNLFDYWNPTEGTTFEEGWRNKLIWGENLLVASSLMNELAGQVDLIYIDPPFATGADFSVLALMGDDSEQLAKEQSVLEEKAYRDTWGRGQESYLQMLYDRLQLLHDLLRDGGSLYLHLDWRFVHDVKLIADEAFGRTNFRNDITWKRAAILGRKATSGQYGRVTDTLLYYTKGEGFTFNRPYTLRPADISAFTWDPVEGKYFKTSPRGDYTDESIARLEKENRIHRTRTGGIRIKYFLEKNGEGQWCERMPTDCLWLDIPDMMHIPESEKTGFETQKPKALLRRIIEASSNPGDLVLDIFAGSGTTAVVAEELGRRWVTCDLGRYATHITRKRLLDLNDCKPFEVLNLGKYERQYWQSVRFGRDGEGYTSQAIFQYLAFVLRLYKAEPVAGMEHLHGRRAAAMIHIGAVDAPVTIDEVNRALDECVALRQVELHILGWEWEMGLAGPNNDVKAGGLMHQAAKERGIKMLLLQIPREVMEEQAVVKGDVQFFELAYLDVAITKPKGQTLVVELKDFVIPNTDLIPDEVRAKITKWSDYIDYWSVDWDFQQDTFIQGFVTYRTRKDRKLSLTSAAHGYDTPGTYRLVVKVIDIFGNDTSQGYTVEI